MKSAPKPPFPKSKHPNSYKTDMFHVNSFAGYNTYTIKQSQGSDETVSSALIGASFGVAPGPFFLNGGLYYALNPIEYGLAEYYNSNVPALYNPFDSSVTDVNSWGGLGVIGF